MYKYLWFAFLFITAGLSANPFVARTFTDENGQIIEVRNVPGIPSELRNPGPIAQPSRSAVILSGVPAFDWSYGCSATSGAMIAGYYDRANYSHIYTGPTNGGVMPLNNSVWGAGECPLSATHQGYDGLLTAGHVDRFWTNSTGNDPFGTGDPTGTYNGCTADYMGTNQDWWGNSDGSTTFFYYVDGSPLYNPSDGTSGPPYGRDGIHGLRLFFESRRYSVTLNYNQYIYGYNGNTIGYTLAQFQASINAGKPVLIQIDGHTMVGIGYESTNSTIYVLNTWDYSIHTMNWGGQYSGMTHYGVGVIELAEPPSISLNGSELTASLIPGQISTDTFTINNLGTGSLIYSLEQSLAQVPSPNLPENEERSIANSTLSLNADQYQPSVSVEWTFTAHNSSPDDEWLREVYVFFPAGIALNSFTNFVDGGGGDMLPAVYSEGDYTVVHWFSDLESWGVVYPGNSATALVSVSISDTLQGNITIPWQIKGDVYGGIPHEISGSFVLNQTPWAVSWFHATPVSGVLDPGMNRLITGHFDATDLEPGTYHAQVSVLSNDPWQPSIVIPVTLEVLSNEVPNIISISSTETGTNIVWEPLNSAGSYKIYRSSDPYSGFDLLFETSATSYLDSEPMQKAFYRITAMY